MITYCSLIPFFPLLGMFIWIWFKKWTLSCVLLTSTDKNVFLKYLYQQWYCKLVNIFGIPLRTSSVKIYIIKISLWSFNITPKYHPMYLKKIETHNPFASFPFHVNSVNSTKEQKYFFFHRIYIYIWKRSSFTSSLK